MVWHGGIGSAIVFRVSSVFSSCEVRLKSLAIQRIGYRFLNYYKYSGARSNCFLRSNGNILSRSFSHSNFKPQSQPTEMLPSFQKKGKSSYEFETTLLSPCLDNLGEIHCPNSVSPSISLQIHRVGSTDLEFRETEINFDRTNRVNRHC